MEKIVNEVEVDLSKLSNEELRKFAIGNNISYSVKRVNTENDKWDIVEEPSDFQYDDKLVIEFQKGTEQHTNPNKELLIEFFVAKSNSLSKLMQTKFNKKLQVNYRQNTNGLVEGIYENDEPFIKCFGVLSYLKGSSIMSRIKY